MKSSPAALGLQSYGYTVNSLFYPVLSRYFLDYHIFLKVAAYKTTETISSFPHLSISPVMGNLLYIIAVILVIIWAVSFFGGFFTGGIIHTLLVIAIIAILLRVISGRSAV